MSARRPKAVIVYVTGMDETTTGEWSIYPPIWEANEWTADVDTEPLAGPFTSRADAVAALKALPPSRTGRMVGPHDGHMVTLVHK